MKASFPASIALLLFCCAPLVSEAQVFRWAEGPGPEGGHVRSIAYAGEGHVYLTVDGHGIFHGYQGLPYWNSFPSVSTPRGITLIHVTHRDQSLLLSGSDSLLRRCPYR